MGLEDSGVIEWRKINIIERRERTFKRRERHIDRYIDR